MSVRRIGLFGGAFDPPHNGHVYAIRIALASGVFDGVWVFPCGDRADKSVVASAEHRLRMTELLIASQFSPDEGVKICTEQLEGILVDASSIALLDYLVKTHGRYFSFHYIIGADLVAEIPAWKCAERLMKEHLFYVVARPGVENARADLPDHVRLLPPSPAAGEPSGASSTSVRALLRQGGNIAGLVPEIIRNYIAGHGLYSGFFQ